MIQIKKNKKAISKYVVAVTVSVGLVGAIYINQSHRPAIAVALTSHTSPTTSSRQHTTTVTGSAGAVVAGGPAIIHSSSGQLTIVRPSTVTSTFTAAVVSPVAPQPVAPTPVTRDFYINTANTTYSSEQAWLAQHGPNAAMSRALAQPDATWFGDWNTNVQTDVNAVVTAATNAGKLPLLVAYNIPNRDCGGESKGGAGSAAGYAAWIAAFANGIGKRSALVIIEPDALAANCYTEARASIIANAVSTLVATTTASLYLDAGNSAWLPTSTIADRLKVANIVQADGFSLNVANFQTTATSTSYGTRLSQLVANKHFVIDTSRNGSGPTTDAQTCNPDGRTFGNNPTQQTGNALVDAYLWIKTPGESDGQCGPNQSGTTAPISGAWWPEYLMMLGR